MDRRLRDGQLTVKRSHRVSGNRRKDASDLDIYLERVTERVTGIEPALSAWESYRSGSLTALTWTADAPPVTVIDPATPWLMARQCPRSGCVELVEVKTLGPPRPDNGYGPYAAILHPYGLWPLED